MTMANPEDIRWAAPIKWTPVYVKESADLEPGDGDELLANRVDVIITSSLERRVDDLLLIVPASMNIPIIAESASLESR
jgi:hypothetical protein